MYLEKKNDVLVSLEIGYCRGEHQTTENKSMKL